MAEVGNVGIIFMLHLFEELKQSAIAWRKEGYPCKAYPLISEILTHQKEENEEFGGPPDLKYLRPPQFLALEIYWYIRLVLGTPHIIDLYKHYYENSKEDFFDALGVSVSRDALEWATLDGIIEKIKNDEDFVKEKRIQALHEALVLNYPSYIFALAMGAGKTVLIGAIIATEFAMSLRCPEDKFMKNALVFAPGTTIIESLRELSDMPYEKILPASLLSDFLANLKIEFPSKSKEIQAQTGSNYNLIVTNTEKISLRRPQQKANQTALSFKEKKLQANLRLQKIASLPNLGIFSDEAHHTYGNLFENLKRVRQTIDYIHKATPLVAVINTTGTPYYKKQILKEVVIWYGLGDGIADNVLKALENGIHQYDIADQSDEKVFNDIIEEFFNYYGEVKIFNGAKAKIAFYFKTQEHLNNCRPLIEQAMTSRGEDVSQILVNTQKSAAAEIDQFKRLNNPDNQKRVILLIGKGVEGWNCPSLFACALIKEQTNPNYVLQASTRCLRQTPGNTHSAKIFLDSDNAVILDKQLSDHFGTDLGRLMFRDPDTKPVTLRILKTKLPQLEITRTIKQVVRKQTSKRKVALQKPEAKPTPAVLRSILTPDFAGTHEILMPTGEMQELPARNISVTCYTAAWKVAQRYHLPTAPILKKLNEFYPQGKLPQSHLYGLFQQVEEQQMNYKTIEEKVTDAMALIRMQDKDGKDLFEKDENNVYFHHLRLHRKTFDKMNKDGLLVEAGQDSDDNNLSFHYTPYNFDSQPERSLFKQVLSILNATPDEIETFLFTGGLTDTGKTDFYFEYLGKDQRYHNYFPDFVIVKKTGEFYIIEIKDEDKRGDPVVKAKEKAVKKLERLQSNKFKYEVIYASAATVRTEKLRKVSKWVQN